MPPALKDLWRAKIFFEAVTINGISFEIDDAPYAEVFDNCLVARYEGSLGHVAAFLWEAWSPQGKLIVGVEETLAAGAGTSFALPGGEPIEVIEVMFRVEGLVNPL